MMPRSQLRLVAACLSVGAAILALILAPPATPPRRPPPKFPARSVHAPEEMEQIYKECCRLVERHYRDARKLAAVPLSSWTNRYDGKIHTDRELATAVYDMLQANTDEQSAFFEVGQFQWWLAKKRQQDVGAQITVEKHRVTGMSDAIKSRGVLQPGDLVLFVDGQNVDVFSDDELKRALNMGPPKSIVRLTVLRQKKKGDEPRQHSFDLVREFDAESTPVRPHLDVDQRSNDDSYKQAIGEEHWDAGPRRKLVRLELLRMHSPGIIARTVQELEKFKKDNVEGLCIDLTGTTGGGPNTVAALAALFLDQGELFTVVEEASDPIRHVYVIEGGKLIHRRICAHAEPIDLIVSDKVNVFDKPLTVAMDLNTTGGAKVLAGILQEKGRAAVVGPVSEAVKPGLVAYPVGRQHYLVLTAAQYVKPDGAPITVVQPDDEMTAKSPNYERGEMGGQGNGLSPSDIAERAVKVLHERVRDRDQTSKPH